MHPVYWPVGLALAREKLLALDGTGDNIAD